MRGLVYLATTIGLLVGISAPAYGAAERKNPAVAQWMEEDLFPASGAAFVDPDADLSWPDDANAIAYDVYFSADEQAVADRMDDVFQGRQEATTFDPGPLEPLATYYWRVDVVGADGEIQPSSVWSFTTVDFIVVDGFESYTNESGHRVFETWIDGVGTPEPIPGQPLNASGALVGHDIWDPESPHYQGTIMETENSHGGSQAVPLYYDNASWEPFSETYRQWETPQDWTVCEADTLSLWFRGEPTNSAEPFYLVPYDKTESFCVVEHPDPNALLAAEWQPWHTPLLTLVRHGVDITAIKRLHLGIGELEDPQANGVGLVYIDDITLTRSTMQTDPNAN